ncbi:TapY2 family type IVa secretion system protein [Flocculibacter collagenilyticus]|uniref:TapY2 family type IVa secretion system protein n=1 Tax=Flocculibacter collagenilyticus TaxID=2744479 RepID=UPI0018F3685A|nr:TapY2 family type IVa secretion system protein [Flocculibacter collagenilyticus]
MKLHVFFISFVCICTSIAFASNEDVTQRSHYKCHVKLSSQEEAIITGMEKNKLRKDELIKKQFGKSISIELNGKRHKVVDVVECTDLYGKFILYSSQKLDKNTEH